jgi:predicted Rossmann-fold nucleotide-binding protein
MKVLICGGRDFTDRSLFYSTMDDLSEELDFDGNQPITIIEGGARGADTLAREYAEESGWGLEEYPADWKKDGRRAGYVRNTKMLEEGRPDVVVAFPGGKGTAMMVDIAKRAEVPVRMPLGASEKVTDAFK